MLFPKFCILCARWPQLATISLPKADRNMFPSPLAWALRLLLLLLLQCSAVAPPLLARTVGVEQTLALQPLQVGRSNAYHGYVALAPMLSCSSKESSLHPACYTKRSVDNVSSNTPLPPNAKMGTKKETATFASGAMSSRPLNIVERSLGPWAFRQGGRAPQQLEKHRRMPKVQKKLKHS